MVQSQLYHDAFERFRKQAKSEFKGSRERAILEEFLQQKGTPEEAKKAAEVLSEDAGKKYGGNNFLKWRTAILDNIGNFIQLGNYATTSAPESVGLAWFAVRLTLGAIQQNYELYNFFGTGLSDISEIMILIPHYDRLYDERDKRAWEASAVVAKLYEDIIAAYVAVLDFSLAVRLHLKPSIMGRLGHGLKDFFGLQQLKFKGKLEVISKQKEKILEGSQAAFQDRALTGLEGTKDMVDDLQKAVTRIQDFQPVLWQLHKEQEARLGLIHGNIEYIKDRVDQLKPKTPWELAVQEFEKVDTMLSPANDMRAAFREQANAAFPGTCNWIFDDATYCQWTETPGRLLCISGPEGTGKSILLSVVVNRLQGHHEGVTLLYTSCRETASRNVDSIYRTLLSQLHSVACDENEQATDLLEACNKVLLASLSANSMSSGDFVSIFKKMADWLKVEALVVVDAADVLAEEERDRLSRGFYSLFAAFMADPRPLPSLRVLVGSCSPFELSRRPPGKSLIPTGKGALDSPPLTLELGGDKLPGHKLDLERKLLTCLEDVTGLSEEEQSLAAQTILGKAEGRFSYIDKAMRLMREPLQRPLERHLELLPEMNAKYDAELLKIGPNYRRLLRTALTWGLLGKIWPPAVVVMDDFNGIYKTAAPEPWQIEEIAAESDAGFSDLSKLDAEQLRAASGPFLSLRDGLIVVQDHRQVSKYFLERPTSHPQNHKVGEMCARCQSETSLSESLSISKKDGHLDLAIACLTHLNKRLFQARAGLLAGFGTEITAIPFTDSSEDDDREARKLLGTVGSQNRCDTRGVIRVEWEAENHDMDDENGSDDSDFAEYLELRQKNNFSEPGVADVDHDPLSVPVRYEVQYWPYHLREAEDLWTPDQRASSEKWEEAFAQLDKLIHENGAIFSAWQRQYQMSGSLTGVFTFAEPRKPLHVAACLGLTSWAARLIDQGENVNELSGGFNALQAAASGAVRRRTMLRLLLEAGADINAESDTAPPAFHMWLSGDSSAESIDLMLQHRADVTMKSRASAWTALHHFADQGTEVEALEALVSKGGDVNAASDDGTQPLHLLLSRPQVPFKVLHAFVETYKADVNAENGKSVRPIQLAARLGKKEALQVLHRSRVLDYDDEDNDGNTALHEAIMFDQTGCVYFLINQEADYNHANKKGTTPFQMAALFDDRLYVDYMLDAGDDGTGPDPLTWADPRGRTPLFYACNAKSAATALLLLENLLDESWGREPVAMSKINQPRTKDKKTPLHCAASRGFDGVVAQLINSAQKRGDMDGLDINLRDTVHGMTALHHAVRHGHLETVRLLLDAGADVSLKDSQEKTALVMAREKWTICHDSIVEDMVSLLIDKDHKAASMDCELSALCAIQGSSQLLRQLHHHGAHLNTPDRYGWTPLELARTFQHAEAQAFLEGVVWAGMLPSRWIGPSFRNTIISEDGRTVMHDTRQRRCLSTDKPLPPGMNWYYFEVTLKELSSSPPRPSNALACSVETAIGFCTFTSAAFTFPGWQPKDSSPKAMSWGYASDDGGISKSTGARTGPVYSRVYGPGDTVGCGVDFVKNVSWFTRNGEKWEYEVGGVQGRLAPLLGLHDALEVETNFTGPFMWERGNAMMGAEEGRMR